MVHGVNPESIPRYAPPTVERQEKTCLDCDYYREVCKRQQANGFVHCIGFCAYELITGKTLAARVAAELVEVEPDDPACTDFRDFR